MRKELQDTESQSPWTWELKGITKKINYQLRSQVTSDFESKNHAFVILVLCFYFILWKTGNINFYLEAKYLGFLNYRNSRRWEQGSLNFTEVVLVNGVVTYWASHLIAVSYILYNGHQPPLHFLHLIWSSLGSMCELSY